MLKRIIVILFLVLSEAILWNKTIGITNYVNNLNNYFIFLQGLAITFVSDENDAKILNDVQDRFDVNITELPDEIDLSSYSK